MRGKFITLEGMDGAGKSSHVAWIADWLRARGRRVLVTREPGGTPLGEQLRTLVLNEPMDLRTETLLVFAARQEHLAACIRPALDAGDWVLSDRFTDATYAYQGGGRGLSEAHIDALVELVHPGFEPDLTVLLDVPVETGLARAVVRNGGQGPDRFENERREFFERVRAAYLGRAHRHPERIRVVDASGSIEDVELTVRGLLGSLAEAGQ